MLYNFTRAPSSRRPRLLKGFSRGSAVLLLQRSSHSVAHDMIRSISASSKRRIDPNNCCICPGKSSYSPRQTSNGVGSPFIRIDADVELRMANSKTHYRSQSTYYDRRLRQGPALVRARRPYLFRNAATGLGLFALVSGICMIYSFFHFFCQVFRSACADPFFIDYYTINAVGQDDFADVKVPDEPRKPAQAK